MGRRSTKRDASFRDHRRWLDGERETIETSSLLAATDFARAWLLAMADESEYFDFDLAWARVYRSRANCAAYCQTLCFYWASQRLKKEADSAHNLLPGERAAIAEKHRRELIALNALADALVAGISGRSAASPEGR